MKKQFLKLLMLGAIAVTTAITGCSKKTDGPTEPEENLGDANRWITLSGAVMGTNAGDGNGGTMVYSVSVNDAKDPNKIIDVYSNGFPVRSQRTARLQSSEDGATLFNIAYSGPNGGEFSKYEVNGGSSYFELSDKVNIADYATATPRWAKLFDNDRTGVAVNVSGLKITTETDGTSYKYARGTATVLSLDLKAAGIKTYEQYEIPLTAQEEALGHCIFRLDAPVLNKAANKLIIGTWMRKYNTGTGMTESDFTRLGTKSVVVDYPSLKNPKVITSTVGFGDCSGYRSFNSFLAEDGSIYQATHRDPNGSHILKINQNNEYDNSYKLSLDAALGIKGTYVESWRYAGNGIAYIMYTHNGSVTAPFNGSSKQSFIARVDLIAKTAKQLTLPYEPDLYFFQYQGWVVNGDEVFVAVTPVGKDGNIYILNSRTGAVKKGAKLVNKVGNHYIGVF